MLLRLSNTSHLQQKNLIIWGRKGDGMVFDRPSLHLYVWLFLRPRHVCPSVKLSCFVWTRLSSVCCWLICLSCDLNAKMVTFSSLQSGSTANSLQRRTCSKWSITNGKTNNNNNGDDKYKQEDCHECRIFPAASIGYTALPIICSFLGGNQSGGGKIKLWLRETVY